MSDEKPFAVPKPETSVSDAEGYAVAVGDETLCPPWGNYSEIGAGVVCRTLNSAVAARERKAAAQALREASVDLIAAFDGYAHDVSAWLRSRAAALEGGAT